MDGKTLYQSWWEKVFNCESVGLSLDELDQLEKVHDDLPFVDGFFWGTTDQYHIQATKEFIALARKKLKEGYEISYYSWW